jgi:hypothetical protein
MRIAAEPRLVDIGALLSLVDFIRLQPVWVWIAVEAPIARCRGLAVSGTMHASKAAPLAPAGGGSQRLASGSHLARPRSLTGAFLYHLVVGVTVGAFYGNVTHRQGLVRVHRDRLSISSNGRGMAYRARLRAGLLCRGLRVNGLRRDGHRLALDALTVYLRQITLRPLTGARA